MASAEALSADVLKVIADQIGERLTGHSQRALSSGQALEIAESFPIWMIGLSATADPAVSLQLSAEPTGYWHHQIHHNRQPVEFAKSRSTGPNAKDWRVEEIVTSQIAARVDAAIRWLDNNLHSEDVVRLLVIPAYFVQAFWIVEALGNRILLIDRPASLSMLEYERLYPEREFFKVLSQQPHVVGIPPEQPGR